MKAKPADLSAGLVAVKGTARPSLDRPSRTARSAPPAGPATPNPAPIADTAAMPRQAMRPAEGAKEANLAPLNFRIPASFRREFRIYAAQHDLKLNELLRRCFEAYRRQQGE